MSRLVRYTDSEWVLDQGKELWPAREDMTEEEEWVVQALAGLTPRQQAVVEMKIYEGVSFHTIGKRFGISRQAAHKIYHKALKKMEGIPKP